MTLTLNSAIKSVFMCRSYSTICDPNEDRFKKKRSEVRWAEGTSNACACVIALFQGQNEGLAIRNMDQSVRDLCTQFEGLSPYDINCLKDFLEPRCQQFVSWVRETMKGNTY